MSRTGTTRYIEIHPLLHSLLPRNKDAEEEAYNNEPPPRSKTSNNNQGTRAKFNTDAAPLSSARNR